MTSGEEQHQSLHYIQQFFYDFYAVKSPVAITKKIPPHPPHNKKVCSTFKTFRRSYRAISPGPGFNLNRTPMSTSGTNEVWGEAFGGGQAWRGRSSQNGSVAEIPIAWYKARIPVFLRKSIREGASGLCGPGRRDPKISLALEQPRLAPVQPWGCSRARDNSGTLRPRPEKTTCSFPYRFSGKNTNSGLVPGNRDPNFVAPRKVSTECHSLFPMVCVSIP